MAEQWTEATMAPQLSIKVLQTDGTAIVRLAGELDAAVASQLHDAMHGLHGQVTVDAGELTFMDAAGLGVLATVASQCQRFKVRDATGIIRSVIEICGFEDWTAVVEDASADRVDSSGAP